MNIYVFRISYKEPYDDLKSEILRGILRQGWGCEGTDLQADSFDKFHEAGTKADWGEEISDSCFARKYNNLRIMLNMKAGDLIVIPKLNIKTPLGDRTLWSQTFTVVEVTEGYKFSPLAKYDDFGHVIGVKVLASFSYTLDDLTRIISAAFKGYQRAVNNVYSEAFIDALNKLMKRQEDNPEYSDGEDKFTLEALASSVTEQRGVLLENLVKAINKWSPHHLEDAIIQLFVKNGFMVGSTHKYNKAGGDIDVSFILRPSYSFIGDIALSVSHKFSEVRVQAKKKTGKDWNDHEGVSQLFMSEGHENTINILINTTSEFSEETREEAEEKGITLISGLEFADLLLRYGLVFTD